MAYRYGDREQCGLFPQSVEDYVGKQDPVRVYDAFVESLDFKGLGIELDEGQVGNSEYDPKAMMKLLVYGYSYGVKGSRKLERECHHNLSFMWLMGGLKPDHKTIAEYRRRHKKALKQVLKQCVRLCIKLDLIAGNVLFVDGTKIRANAGRGKSHGREWYEKRLKELDARVEQMIEESEKVDNDEASLGSSVAMGKELAQAQRLQDKIKQALTTLEQSGRDKLNLTDPDSALMKSRQGSHTSYNVQSVVDDRHGLIVHAEAVSATSDVNQFAKQIDQANQMLAKPCEVAVGDAGYADTEELKKIDAQGTKWWFPPSAKHCTTERTNRIARVISVTTGKRTATSAPSRTFCPMSLPTRSAARSTTGSPRRGCARGALILAYARPTPRGGGSCGWSWRTTERSSKRSMKRTKRSTIAARS